MPNHDPVAVVFDVRPLHAESFLMLSSVAAMSKVKMNSGSSNSFSIGRVCSGVHVIAS